VIFNPWYRMVTRHVNISNSVSLNMLRSIWFAQEKAVLLLHMQCAMEPARLTSRYIKENYS
jgi:hypothetical protein